MRVAMTGSSGLIGTALRSRLAASGHEVVPIVRRPPGAGEIGWDPDRLDPGRFEGIDAAVNLAGAGIADHRWTDSYRRQILDSRVRTTAALARALAAASRHGGPAVLLSGSGIDVYGDSGSALVDESSPRGSGFLADVCRAWESATDPAAEAGVRVAHLRTSMVLAGGGGALRRLVPLFKLGLGGRMGSGRQWMSWISIDDQVGAIEHLLSGDVRGPVIMASPDPVTNAEFARTLGRVLHRPVVVPIPAFGPKLVLGADLAQTLLFDGQRATPRALLTSGYQYAHPTLETALRAVLGR